MLWGKGLEHGNLVVREKPALQLVLLFCLDGLDGQLFELHLLSGQLGLSLVVLDYSLDVEIQRGVLGRFCNLLQSLQLKALARELHILEMLDVVFVCQHRSPGALVPSLLQLPHCLRLAQSVDCLLVV